MHICAVAEQYSYVNFQQQQENRKTRQACSCPTLTMPDEATEKTMAVDDRAARTVWVGGLPASMSTGSDVEKILRRVGDIESAHVRVKEGVNKNWALVLFKTAESAQSVLTEKQRMATMGLSSTTGWKIKMVQPEKLASMEAQFTIAGVEMDSDPTRSIGGQGQAVGTKSSRSILKLAASMVSENAENTSRKPNLKGDSARLQKFSSSDNFPAQRPSHSSRRARQVPTCMAAYMYV